MSDADIVARLATALRGIGYDATAVELAEILWLAPHLPPHNPEDRPAPSFPTAPAGEPPSLPEPTESLPTTSQPTVDTTGPANPDGRGLYAWTQPSTDATGVRPASIIRAPAAPALPHALALSRALRPLLKKRISTREWQLDEGATVDATAANNGVITPVFSPGVERWFELALVVEQSPSMYVWRKTIMELRQLLARHGGFRDLRQFALRVADDKVELVTESGRTASPDLIADPSGHRLIVIVTDAMSRDWRRRPLRRTFHKWARLSPVVLLHVLPRRMWPHTAVGFAERAMYPPRAGAPNTDWWVEQDWWESPAETTILPIPVMTLEAEQFASWARSLMQVSAGVCTGMLLGVTDSFEPPDSTHVQPLTATERVQRFRSRASPLAYQLACYFAATQVVLPILRIVQSKMLPSTGPGYLAEFLMSDLIYPVTNTDGRSDAGNPEKTVYEFHAGVRDLLLDQLQSHEAPRIASAIEEFLATHLGRSYDLQALVLDDRGTETVSGDALPFVTPALELLERMGVARRKTSFLDKSIDVLIAHFGAEPVEKILQEGLNGVRGLPEQEHKNYILRVTIGLMPEEQIARIGPLGFVQPVRVVPPTLWRELFTLADIVPLDVLSGLTPRPDGGLTMDPEVRTWIWPHIPVEQHRLMHERIVRAYHGSRSMRSVSLFDDGYYFQHVMKHVAEAADEQTAEELFLDQSWIARKIQVTDVRSLIEDLKRFPNNPRLRALAAVAQRKETIIEDAEEWAESVLLDWRNSQELNPAQQTERNVGPVDVSQRPTVFVSYSRRDAPAVDRIRQTLEDAGVNVWLDATALSAGEEWQQEIRRAIQRSDLFIAVLSTDVIQTQTSFVYLEWRIAEEYMRMRPDTTFVVPIAIDDISPSDERLPEFLRVLHWHRAPRGRLSTETVKLVARALRPSPSVQVAKSPSPAGTDLAELLALLVPRPVIEAIASLVRSVNAGVLSIDGGRQSPLDEISAIIQQMSDENAVANIVLRMLPEYAANAIELVEVIALNAGIDTRDMPSHDSFVEPQVLRRLVLWLLDKIERAGNRRVLTLAGLENVSMSPQTIDLIGELADRLSNASRVPLGLVLLNYNTRLPSKSSSQVAQFTLKSVSREDVARFFEVVFERSGRSFGPDVIERATDTVFKSLHVATWEYAELRQRLVEAGRLLTEG